MEIPKALQFVAAVPWSNRRFATPLADIALMIRTATLGYQQPFERLAFNLATAIAIVRADEFERGWCAGGAAPNIPTHADNYPKLADYEPRDATARLLPSFVGHGVPCVTLTGSVSGRPANISLSQSDADGWVFLLDREGVCRATLFGF